MVISTKRFHEKHTKWLNKNTSQLDGTCHVLDGYINMHAHMCIWLQGETLLSHGSQSICEQAISA